MKDSTETLIVFAILGYGGALAWAAPLVPIFLAILVIAALVKILRGAVQVVFPPLCRSAVALDAWLRRVTGPRISVAPAKPKAPVLPKAAYRYAPGNYRITCQF
jgi:hypothetical protein